MSDSTNSDSPSSLGAFFRGFGSGALNGALMMGMLFAVSHLAVLVGITAAAPIAIEFLRTAAIATLTTGLFSGIMSAKDSIFPAETPHSASYEHDRVVPVPALGLSSPTPTLSSELDAPEAATRTNWVAQTGRAGDAHTRVQQILSNGSLSDKDRASSLLAAREAAANAPSLPPL